MDNELKEWEKEVPLGIVRSLGATRGKSSTRSVDVLEREECPTMTSIGRIREIAKKYSKRYGVPIKISEEPFREHPHADAIHQYWKGKSTIYLHPILKYYPESYIEGCIEHEIDHREVERKWEDIL